jgi:hypothetical protein
MTWAGRRLRVAGGYRVAGYRVAGCRVAGCRVAGCRVAGCRVAGRYQMAGGYRGWRRLSARARDVARP